MLNDIQIKALKALKATGVRYEITFGNGLYLDITPTGAKIWRYRYRLHGQREKVTIGPYPAIGLKEANAQVLGTGCRWSPRESHPPANKCAKSNGQAKRALLRNWRPSTGPT